MFVEYNYISLIKNIIIISFALKITSMEMTEYAFTFNCARAHTHTHTHTHDGNLVVSKSSFHYPCQWGLEYAIGISCRGVKPSKKRKFCL